MLEYYNRMKLKEKLKEAIKEELKNFTGTLRIEISQGGINDIRLDNIKIN